MLIEFLEFGNLFLVARHLFAARKVDGGERAILYSTCGEPVEIDGDEARQFWTFAEAYARPVMPADHPAPGVADEITVDPMRTAPRPDDTPLRRAATGPG